MDTNESFQQNNQQKSRRFSKRTIIIASIALILCSVVGVVSYSYFINRDNGSEVKSATDIQDALALKGFVSQLIEVPANETPTMATVNDKTKLNNQEFFKNTENGDKVLIFEQAKKAYLYRPSTNKIIEVTLISPESNTANPANR